MMITSCDLYEPNDDRAENPAGPLASGQAIAAKICVGDIEDNYFFDTSTDEQIQISLTLPSKLVGKMAIWVYHQSDLRQNRAICGKDVVSRASDTLLCSLNQPGTYVVRLYTNDGSFDDLNYYTMRVDYR
jgi:hypothetical protein